MRNVLIASILCFKEYGEFPGCLAHSSILKMMAVYFSETFNFYQMTSFIPGNYLSAQWLTMAWTAVSSISLWSYARSHLDTIVKKFRLSWKENVCCFLHKSMSYHFYHPKNGAAEWQCGANYTRSGGWTVLGGRSLLTAVLFTSYWAL
jgi:hypothetical protein